MGGKQIRRVRWLEFVCLTGSVYFAEVLFDRGIFAGGGLGGRRTLALGESLHFHEQCAFPVLSLLLQRTIIW